MAQEVIWSPQGKKLISEGQQFHCPKCGLLLSGERFCPSCGRVVSYPGEDQQAIKQQVLNQSKWTKASKGSSSVANVTGKAGSGLSHFGCTMTLLVTIPIILILLFLLM